MNNGFIKLNDDWNADPNDPRSAVADGEEAVLLRFRPNVFVFPKFKETAHLYIEFRGCSRYRFTSVNDHAWYLGQCRFSALAPDWGEFYEVTGDFRAAQNSTPWTERRGPSARRNFLFYLRDETFECTATDWSLRQESPAGLKFQEPFDVP